MQTGGTKECGLPEGNGSLETLKWAVGGGAALLMAWLGALHRQVWNMRQTQAEEAREDRSEMLQEMATLRERVDGHDKEISGIKNRMVTTDDLERSTKRIEESVHRLGEELRSDIKDSHRRIDQVYRNGHTGESSR
jgi:predicted nuclease with TOPRIM domain